MAIKIFTHKLLRMAEEEKGRLDELDALVREFKEYKQTGSLPKIFGRDALYERPPSIVDAELRHVHLLDETVKKPWLRILQYTRTSDSCLVYCQGTHSSDNYLLIALLRYNPLTKIGVHARTRKTTFLLELAEIAEGFRKVY